MQGGAMQGGTGMAGGAMGGSGEDVSTRKIFVRGLSWWVLFAQTSRSIEQHSHFSQILAFALWQSMNTRFKPSLRVFYCRDTTTESLRAMFSQFGEVEDAVVTTDRISGKSKGYGFVTFRFAVSASAAVAEPEKQLDVSKLAAYAQGSFSLYLNFFFLSVLCWAKARGSLSWVNLLLFVDNSVWSREGFFFYQQQRSSVIKHGLGVVVSRSSAHLTIIPDVKLVSTAYVPFMI